MKRYTATEYREDAFGDFVKYDDVPPDIARKECGFKKNDLGDLHMVCRGNRILMNPTRVKLLDADRWKVCPYCGGEIKHGKSLVEG